MSWSGVVYLKSRIQERFPQIRFDREYYEVLYDKRSIVYTVKGREPDIILMVRMSRRQAVFSVRHRNQLNHTDIDALISYLSDGKCERRMKKHHLQWYKLDVAELGQEAMTA